MGFARRTGGESYRRFGVLDVQRYYSRTEMVTCCSSRFRSPTRRHADTPTCRYADTILPVLRASSPSSVILGHGREEQDDCRPHQAKAPDQIEIDPGTAQDRQADEIVYHPGDESGDH
jgi:hypothetical protein